MKIGEVTPLQLNSKVGSSTKTPEQNFKQMLDRAVGTKDDQQLKEAAKQFEALFIYQMFKQMRQTVPKGELFKESMSEQIFQGMLDQEVSNTATGSGGLGMADIIYKQMKMK